MSEAAVQEIGRVAMAGMSLATTSILLQSTFSLMQFTQQKMKPLTKLQIPELSEIQFGSRPRRRKRKKRKR